MAQIIIPVALGLVVFIGVWSFLTVVSQRNSRTQERLQRISRPASLAEIEVPGKQSREEKLQGLKKQMEALGDLLKPKTELEQNAIKIRLANAGFRSDSAAGIYQGIRVASFTIFTIIAVFLFLVWKVQWPFLDWWAWMTFIIAFGMFAPNLVLAYLKSQRQQ